MVNYFPQIFYSVFNLNNKSKVMAIQVRHTKKEENQQKQVNQTNDNRNTPLF